MGVYVINLDEYKSIGTNWLALHVDGDNESASNDATNFHSFGIEHISEQIKKFIGNKNIMQYKYTIL